MINAGNKMLEFENYGKIVHCTKKAYIEAKTCDLIEFGYSSLSKDEVAKQLQLVLEGSGELSVIGKFIEADEIKEVE